MANRLITAKEAAKDFYNGAVEEVKKSIPDSSGQKEPLNPEQATLLAALLNSFSRAMFYGPSPH